MLLLLLAHTPWASPPGRDYRGVFRQPLRTVFMNSDSASILKLRKLSPRVLSCLAQRAFLPEALAMQPHDQVAGWGVEGVWASAPPPAPPLHGEPSRVMGLPGVYHSE